MEFEQAAQRLEREQSKLRGRTRNSHVSAKAKREADYRKRQQQLMLEQREREQAKLDYLQKWWRKCEHSLGVQELAPDGLFLKPTSIYGDGDKIALPPSVLETLSQGMESEGSSSPWMFRVAIPNPNYIFPASLSVQNIKGPIDDAMEEDSDDDDYGSREQKEYLEELSHKYIAYSLATVVEFTQDEGQIGLPLSIASTLLNSQRRHILHDVPSMRTCDPSAGGDVHVDSEFDKTPGHLAWGAFDVPDVPLKISLIKLPKGTGCTLVPTVDAIRNGFHQLKDVKLVLEQSIVRTRATLSVGDIVHSWHRGAKFDLTVTSVTPADWNSISVVNTDVEVNIGVNEETEQLATNIPALESSTCMLSGHTLGRNIDDELKTTNRGNLPSGDVVSDEMSAMGFPEASPMLIDDLVPEPPSDQTVSICTVQIRADQGSGRRRFDVTAATVRDLFTFASTVTKLKSFQLVTRFPRKVLTMQDITLLAAGIEPGQELFLVEQIQNTIINDVS